MITTGDTGPPPGNLLMSTPTPGLGGGGGGDTCVCRLCWTEEGGGTTLPAGHTLTHSQLAETACHIVIHADPDNGYQHAVVSDSSDGN